MPSSGAGRGSLSVITHPLTQHLISVLSQGRWRPPDGARFAVQLPGRSHLADPARARMLDLEPHLPPRRQRTFKRLLDIEDRTGWNPKLLEARQPFFARASTKIGFDPAGQLVLDGLAQGVGRQCWVIRELRRANRVAKPLELGIGRNRDVEESIADGEGPVRSDRGVVVAFLGRDLTSREISSRLVGEEREQRIVEGDIDVAALAGGCSLDERREDRVGSEHPRRDIADGNADLGRRPIGRRVHAHHPRRALGDLVVTRECGLVLAESADRRVDERRLQSLQPRGSKAEPFHRAGFEVFDDDVAGLRQGLRDVKGFLLLEIEDHASLVPVHGEEIGRLASYEWRPPLARVVARGRFDFDDVGAKVAKQHRAVRAGQRLCEVQDTDGDQWKRRRIGHSVDYRRSLIFKQKSASFRIHAAIGALAGLGAGLLGVGGGFLIVPLLTLWARTDQHRATGTSLAAILPIALVGAGTYYFASGTPQTDLPVAASLVVGGTAGVIGGGLAAQKYSDRVLRGCVPYLLFVPGLKYAYDAGFGAIPTLHASAPAALGIEEYVVLALWGLGIGVLGGLAGLGGGVFIVPLLVIGFGLSQRIAQGTSLIAVIPTAAIGAIIHEANGEVDVRAAGLIAGAGVPAAIVGSLLALVVPQRTLLGLFGAFLLFAAVATWPWRQATPKV